MPELLVPHFTYGTYQSADGTPVKFDDALMRQIDRNTNFAVRAKILSPPLTYDAIDEDGRYLHNSAKSTDAHGTVTRAVYENGVLKFGLAPSSTLLNDIRDLKRLRVSGVVDMKYWYNDASGKRVELGPTLIATTALGAKRPAMRNEKIVPLQDLVFSEDTTPVDAFYAREELRKSGFVAQTLADGNYAFSEIDVDPHAFGEPSRQEQGMTDEQIQAAIASGIKAVTAPLEAKLAEQAAQNLKLTEQVRSFSETSKREGEAHAFCEKFRAARAKTAPLNQLSMERLEDLLSDPEMTPGTITKLKAFAESLPGAYVAAPPKDDDEDTGKGGDKTEPKALAALRPKHFSDLNVYGEVLEAGLNAFSEFQPDAFKGIENNPEAQLDKLRRYVTARDTAN